MVVISGNCFRIAFTKLFLTENRCTCHKHKHNLICRKASFHKNVTEKTFACVLIIGCHSERGEELAYCNDDFVGNNILCLTAVNSDNMMTARLIHT